MNPRSNKPIPPPIKPGNGWPWQAKSGHWLPDSRRDGAAKISIVIPSYNQGRFLEAAIRSVLLQEHPPEKVECIVIDGGSTDESKDILDYYSPWLNDWVSEPDRGQTHAINKGISRSTGEILAWLNSDDLYVKGAFRRIAGSLQTNPDCVLVHGNRILIDEESHVCGWFVPPAFDPETTGYNVCSETAFWRRSTMGDLMLKEEMRFAMDLELFCRLFSRGRFVKLNAFLGCFRCHDTSKSSTLTSICKEETEREWKAIFGANHEGWQRRGKPDRLRQVLPLFRNPSLITFPYLYRRFILGRRGI